MLNAPPTPNAEAYEGMVRAVAGICCSLRAAVTLCTNVAEEEALFGAEGGVDDTMLETLAALASLQHREEDIRDALSALQRDAEEEEQSKEAAAQKRTLKAQLAAVQVTNHLYLKALFIYPDYPRCCSAR
jgi:hypothetical protein